MNKNKIIAMLRELKDTAMEATLTGAFRDTRTLHVMYNDILKVANKQGLVEDPDLFQMMSQDASLSDIGINAGLLAKYIEAD